VSSYIVDGFLPADPTEDKQVIIHLHGISNKDWVWRSNADTMFKRLYWAGYRGRFASFRWSCGYLFPDVINPFQIIRPQFNRSDFYAYKSAAGFKAYVNYLKNARRTAGYSINVFAHSQGNQVASEAMVQGLTIDNYILTQGAVAAHCYDTLAPNLQPLVDKEATSHTPFLDSQGGYHSYFEGLSGNLVNFYNPLDFALATGEHTIVGGVEVKTNWEKNQENYKPEIFNTLSTTRRYFFNTFAMENNLEVRRSGQPTLIFVISDFHETRSMVARSRTKAIGALGPNQGQTTQGSIRSAVNLHDLVGFGTAEDDHNGQNAKPIQNVTLYYDRVLDVIDMP
jgi:hypothetical protein